MECTSTELLIEWLFVEQRLPRAEVEALLGHLRTCRGCRDRYERAVTMERLLVSAGEDSEVPVFAELAWLMPRVLDKVR